MWFVGQKSGKSNKIIETNAGVSGPVKTNNALVDLCVPS